MKLSLVITLAAMLVVNLPGNLLGQITYTISHQREAMVTKVQLPHPGSISPAINKDTSLLIPDVDLDSITRPHDTGYDIGAYEHNELITEKRTEQVIQDEVVYQNPVTNGILQIGMTNKSVTFLAIYSIVGECVYKQNLIGSDSAVIQVGAWQKGLYLLNFTSGKQSITRKVIIR